MIGIYKITSPSKKVYIGSSNNIPKRLNYYKSGNCKGQIKLYNSILKYGWINHKVEVLEVCNLDELYQRELYYGTLYNVLSVNGLNLILPKNNEVKTGISDETRRRMSESRMGVKNSFYGKKHSEETRKKIAIAQTGRKHTDEHRKKVSMNNTKNMAKLVVNLETGIFYESIKEASIALDIKHSTLKCRVNGSSKRKTSIAYA
jgi:group I intron endonuclease